MAPSVGFQLPTLALLLGMVVLVAGLFIGGGLNPISYAGLVLGLAGIVGLWLAVLATPDPGHESAG
ncbi:hypothetical protein C479_10585 [Halovivax asiaticus JCM 14624]|uniref:Uncharacterized protein n=1 Tax=Halovivax asiaticus JCM 14624 TaxID=1227490 RepID=M0BEE2_9EURY|nr:hypothetical protein [Halovivax asiaticus]ELZ09261.1 hypothetical protein C479_10585 [Halovivax asiaticus JCM 14624]